MPAHKIQLVWTGVQGSPWVTTNWIDTEVHADPEMAADAVLGAWSTIQSILYDPITFNYDQEVTTYSAPDTPIATEVVEAGPVQGGTNTQHMLPAATQGLLRFDTGVYVGARRVKGRSFVPGLTESSTTTLGFMENSSASVLQGIGGALITAGLMVASRKNNQFYRVTSASVWQSFAVLRTRRD